MKECRQCHFNKPLNEFHKHSQMADGHLNICKECIRSNVRQHRLKKMNDPEWVEKEAERQRKKETKRYYELKGTSYLKNKSKKAGKIYNSKNPEKRYARGKALINIPCKENEHRHHWSYKKENVLDVFILSNRDHFLIHRYLRYVKKEMCYMTKGGTLLDTREKHEKFISIILKAESIQSSPQESR